MKIKLHNKFEINHNGKIYQAFNTLLSGIYNKIANLEQYTSHIAIGTGTTRQDSSASRLGTYLKTFKAETEEINSSISNSPLYIKKLVTVDGDDEFTFSELGLCASDEFDPEIYNHVLLTDQDGQPVQITRKAGDNLQIRVTVYLELDVQSEALFIDGENDLIRRILGDDFSSSSPLLALRGENLLPNIKCDRAAVDLSNAVEMSTSLKISGGAATISFSAQLGEGKTEEVLIVYNNKVCMRYNTREILADSEEDNSYSCSPGKMVELGEDVKDVISVKKGDTDEQGYTKTIYSNKMTDKLENLFDQNFNSSTPRYVSSLGNMIAFIYSSQVHLYKNEGYGFVKLNATQLPTNNIFKMFILETKILVLSTVEPYVRIFDIVENNVVEKPVRLTEYNASVLSYSWIDANATEVNGKIILGLIVNDENKTPVVLRLTQGSSGNYSDNIERSRLTTATKVYAIHKNPYYKPLVAFLTDKDKGVMGYFLEEFYENSSGYGYSSASAYGLLANSLELRTSGRAVASQKAAHPFLYVYYYPDFKFGGYDLSSGVKHYFSQDGNYVIVKNEDGSYKVKNFHRVGEFVDFQNDLPTYVNQEEVKDFEFINDILLVFTSSEIYGIALKQNLTRLDNVSDENGEYSVKLKKYNLLGSNAFEGVSVSLALNFTATGERTSIVHAPLERIKSLDDIRID